MLADSLALDVWIGNYSICYRWSYQSSRMKFKADLAGLFVNPVQRVAIGKRLFSAALQIVCAFVGRVLM